MGKDTKVITHEGMSSGTGIFYKRGYGKGYYSTYPFGTHCHPYSLLAFLWSFSLTNKY